MDHDLDLRMAILHGPHHTRLLGGGDAEGRDWHRERSARLDEEAQARELAINQATPDLVATADIDGFLLSLNDAGRRLLGLAENAELHRLRLPELFEPGSARALMKTSIPNAVRDQVCHSESVLLGAGGEAIPCSQILIAHRDAASNVSFFSLILRDIRPLRAAEEERRYMLEQLHHVKKMETVGRLAGGIAHDFSNILTVIVGYAELGLDKLHRSEDTREELDIILSSAQRAARLSNQLLDFSVKRAAEPHLLDLNEVVNEGARLIRCLLGEDVSLRLDLAPELYAVKMDRSQMEQILLNLAVNARDAMPAGGRLEIQTANLRLSEQDLLRCGLERAGEYVRFSVSDSGMGMDQEVMEHIFEPFYTTKEHGKGNGIGLASVYGIVRKNHGSICVNSGKGQGAIFDIYLPRAAQEEAAASTTTTPTPAVTETCRERILLVEDNAEIRDLLKRVLDKRGYQVSLAANGLEACTLFREQPGFDLVISDLAMPRMDGRELCKRLREMSAVLPVLLISGHADKERLPEDMEKQGIHLLQKPFPMQVLLDQVRGILDLP